MSIDSQAAKKTEPADAAKELNNGTAAKEAEGSAPKNHPVAAEEGKGVDPAGAEDVAGAAEQDQPQAEAAAPVTDEGRKLLRAQRFGLVTAEIQKQKKIERAERFGIPTPELEQKKKNERAARFGVVTEGMLEQKKKERAARFGISENRPKAAISKAGQKALSDSAGGSKEFEVRYPCMGRSVLPSWLRAPEALGYSLLLTWALSCRHVVSL